MKVFVATKEGQGLRENDFSHTEEGELVFFSYGCDRDKDNVDGGCGCRRGMTGFKNLTSTTTFKVIDMEMTEDEYIDKHVTAMYATGFNDFEEIEDLKDSSRSDSEILLDGASIFPENIILERRGNDIQPRAQFSWSFPPEEDY